jgi:hypothetical protein
MRKGLLALVIIAAATLIYPGCARDKIPPPPPQAQDGNDNTGPQQSYPDSVISWLEVMKPHFAAGVIEEPKTNATYFVINLGEQQENNYTVEIRDIDDQEDIIKVEVAISQPTSTEKSTPDQRYAVEWVDYLIGDKQVEFTDIDQQEYIPMVVGTQPKAPFIKETPNIKIIRWAFDQDLVDIEGIARAFEATLGYAFESSDKQVISTGFVTAAAGGPNWGYFRLKSSEIPDNARKLAIYIESMKDGSRQEEMYFDRQ